MNEYQLIDSDAALERTLQNWKERNILSVAMDFEGEFNLHVYGEHLCLIQLFDGERYALIDPFELSEEALIRFFTSDVEKVMFACDSDCALIRKVYHTQVENVWDIRVQAMALGMTGNLNSLIEHYALKALKVDKKKGQRTNWMVRPLKEKQIEYALGDVEHLLELKELLAADVKKARVEKQVAYKMKRCALPKNPEKPGWEKLPGYRYLKPEMQKRAKKLFIARDNVARRRNLPAYKIMDKRVLVDMAKKLPEDFSTVTRNRALVAEFKKAGLK